MRVADPCELDEPIYVCVLSNTTQKIAVELIPNLMVKGQESFPTKEDSDELQRALFVANSKFMEVTNQHSEFEKKEEEGLEANLRVESGLKTMMMIELGIILFIGCVQYFVLRGFVKKVRRM
jgi:hypothetical protein